MKIINYVRRDSSALSRRAIVAILSFAASATASAAQWELHPFLDVGAIYDDNIQLDTGPHDSTSGFVTAARLDGKRTGETSKLTFSGFVAHTNYTQGNIEDKTEEGATLNAENRLSERATVGVDGEYRHDALFETRLQPPGTGNIRDTDIGLSTNTQVRRNYRMLQPWWNWALTELSAIRLSYRYTDAAFSNEVGTGIVDYREDLVSATYTHQLNPKDDFNLTANSSRYRPATMQDESDTLQLLAGLGRNFSESFHGSFAVGSSRTNTKTASGDDSASGLVATASVRQSSELSTLEGIISRDVTPSGVGQAVRSDQFRVWWSRRYTEATEFVLDAQLFRIQTLQGSTSGIDRRYFDISPQVRYRWLENLYVVGSYRYRKQKYDLIPDSADSNAVFLGLSYGL